MSEYVNPHFSFILLTYNEELHLATLLGSIVDLRAPVFVLDSGSTDSTVAIAEAAGAIVKQHPFENHPKQWDQALKCFPVTTPWVICLDADQVVTDELSALLSTFEPREHTDTNGIYFNRKFIFRDKWIRHGGYFPFYLLKMFRYGIGHSDLNENMDHRLVVPGKTVIWKTGYIIEQNHKENDISFWIAKHNRYSDLLASEEIERMKKLRTQTVTGKFFGSPDERTAWLKKIWWKLPRYIRPVLYFTHRYVFQLGFLDGRTGTMFHFLQGFWFRVVVDVKIGEILKKQRSDR